MSILERFANQMCFLKGTSSTTKFQSDVKKFNQYTHNLMLIFSLEKKNYYRFNLFINSIKKTNVDQLILERENIKVMNKLSTFMCLQFPKAIYRWEIHRSQL